MTGGEGAPLSHMGLMIDRSFRQTDPGEVKLLFCFGLEADPIESPIRPFDWKSVH
jgi:hypothetical protein